MGMIFTDSLWVRGKLGKNVRAEHPNYLQSQSLFIPEDVFHYVFQRVCAVEIHESSQKIDFSHEWSFLVQVVLYRKVNLYTTTY